MRQKGGQSLEQFVVELTEQAQKCKLGDLQNSLIKCMITCGVNSNEMREKLLQDDSLTLEQAIHQCKVMEKKAAKIQSKKMEATGEATGTVDLIKSQKKLGQIQVGGGKSVYKAKEKVFVKCTKCGKNHNLNNCPAYGKFCTKCNKKNYFAIVCKSNYKKKVNEIQDKDEKKVDTLTSQNNEEYLFIGAIENNSEKHVWLTELEINEKRMKFKVDTGAMCNVMSVEHLKSLRLGNIRVKPTDTMLKSYTGDKLQVRGVCTISAKKNNRVFKIDFYIVKTNTPAILGLSSCLELNIIKKLESINDSNTYEDLVKEYKKIFSGIGCFSKPYHIKLKENAQPVIHPTRRVALSLLPKLKECLDELVKLKIIEKVEEATDWVNPLVITRKPNGSLRICLDPKDLNNNIKRKQCLIKTLDEITAKLNGVKVFSSLDATSGFYQIRLDEESSYLCTFSTPFAPEVFQEKFRQTFENCEGCEQYIDDVIVWGKNKAEHDERLRKVLETAKRNKVKFNLSKCQFGKSNVKYMGHIISAEGVALDESKVTAIKELQTPKCKEDVQRVLGMLTYESNENQDWKLFDYEMLKPARMKQESNENQDWKLFDYEMLKLARMKQESNRESSRESRLATNRERNVRFRGTLHADLNLVAFNYDADYDYSLHRSGKVKLPELHLPPDPLSTLVSGDTNELKHFLANIQIICDNYMPTFKVQGQIYHRAGSLLPMPDADYKFLQIYFMGTSDEQVHQRCRFNSCTNPEIVVALQNLFDHHNELVRMFRTALERMPADDYVVVIRADKTPPGQHERQYNAPTINEVAIVIVGEEFNSRDIVLHRRDGLFEVVTKNNIHGPCGAINNNSPCMKDEKCTKRYPRDLHSETITGNDGYPQYRRRSTKDGGKLITI
ncbi:LOW QUALITY PROTEIN: uncharacterized protein [Temnothorax longispinosus]|uniref:LOW QUALITY PROTEIN: uncharacterized protein n=1 Tax=Temnothorax longispinosus TaxID=300112 RepID=UPI003A98D025